LQIKTNQVNDRSLGVSRFIAEHVSEMRVLKLQPKSRGGEVERCSCKFLKERYECSKNNFAFNLQQNGDPGLKFCIFERKFSDRGALASSALSHKAVYYVPRQFAWCCLH